MASGLIYTFIASDYFFTTSAQNTGVKSVKSISLLVIGAGLICRASYLIVRISNLHKRFDIAIDVLCDHETTLPSILDAIKNPMPISKFTNAIIGNGWILRKGHITENAISRIADIAAMEIASMHNRYSAFSYKVTVTSTDSHKMVLEVTSKKAMRDFASFIKSQNPRVKVTGSSIKEIRP